MFNPLIYRLFKDGFLSQRVFLKQKTPQELLDYI